MITQAKIHLNTDAQLNTNMSSLMQGVIMENASPQFAEKEHISAIRSYSQYLTHDSEEPIWVINALNDDAKENIIDRICGLKSIYIRNRDIVLLPKTVEIKTTSFDELFEANYYTDVQKPRYIRLEFITPTAFKSEGMYINYPTVRLLLSSMINKYDALSDITKLSDENLLEQLEKSVSIANYNLHSTLFHLEGVKIPSFMGRVTLKVNGGKNMVSMINMLAEFAQYTGIGIKSAIGMGAVLRTERRERT